MKITAPLGFLLFLIFAASSFSQTTLSIHVDPIPDDSSDPGCSLRDAISVANAGLMAALGCTAQEISGGGFPRQYEIYIPAYQYTLIGPTEFEANNVSDDLDVFSNVTLIGAGVGETVIHGGNESRVIEVANELGNLVIRELTITGGRSNEGAGILVTNGFVRIEHAEIRHNRADFGQGRGGGIANQEGTVEQGPGTIVRDNFAFFTGGGVNSRGRLDIRESLILNNTGGAGGGIYQMGLLTMHSTVLSGNEAFNRGGGMSLFGEPAAGILNSSFIDNSALEGAGLDAERVNIANSTFALNDAVFSGGGIRGADIAMTHVSVVANTAGTIGAGMLASNGAVEISQTLFAQNESKGGIDLACGMRVFSEGYNFVDNNEGCSLAFPAGLPNPSNDFVGSLAEPAAAGLGALIGTPPGVDLLAVSILVDAIPAEDCVYIANPASSLFRNGDPVLSDQLGNTRDAFCDIGAIELIGIFRSGFEGDLFSALVDQRKDKRFDR